MRATVIGTSGSTRRASAILQCPVEAAVQFPARIIVHELEDVPGQLVVTPLEVRRAFQHVALAVVDIAEVWRKAKATGVRTSMTDTSWLVSPRLYCR